MLKVLRNPPNVMGEHTPLHACACLDHACRVHLVPEALTYLPWCLPPPHRQFHSALLVCRERYCGNPHKGKSVVRQDGSGSDSWGRSNVPLPRDDTIDGAWCTPLRSVPKQCNICIDSNVYARLGPSILPSGPNQPLRRRSGEWWTRWELRLLTLVPAFYIFREQSSSRRPWVRVE